MATSKAPRFWPVLQLGRTSAAAGAPLPPANEGLDAFGSEADPSVQAGAGQRPVRGMSRSTHPMLGLAKWTAVILLSAAVAVAAVFAYQRRVAPAATTGTVTIETSPAGLEVAIGGRSMGRTPLTTSLTPGSYDVQVGAAPNARALKVDVPAGGAIVQRLEFAAPQPPSGAATGGLRVQTEPAKLPVLVDGTPRGLSPVSIDNLEPGVHEVAVRTSAGLIRRAISIQPREKLSLLVSSAAPPPDPSVVSAGWMSVSAGVPLQLREGGRLIGTSESDRVMLPSGDHEIEFANAELGFSATKTVRIAAGKTAATRIDVPNGVISVNAQPWAEVWVDGERVGETPIGNLSRPIGKHELVFRHPELGERRETVVLAVGKPTRIGVDLRKK